MLAALCLGVLGAGVAGSAPLGVRRAALDEEAAGDEVSLLQRRAGPAPVARPAYFWAGKNGDLARTGASAFASPSNLSAGPSWSFDGDLVRAAPLIDAERNIYLSTIPGYVYKMSPQGAVLWRHRATGEIPSVPAIAGGLVFANSQDGNVAALDMATGARRWLARAGACSAADTASVTATGRVVVVAVGELWCDVNTHIVALSAEDGSLKWSFRPDLPVYNFLSAVVEGSLVFSDFSGKVYRLDLETGRLLWKFAETSPTDLTTGGAVVGPNRVVYVTHNVGNMMTVMSSQGTGRLSAFSLDTGARIWFQDTGLLANNAAAVGVLHPSGKGPLSVVVGVGENPDQAPQRPGIKRGQVLAFDAETGRRLDWAYSPPVWPFAAAAGDTPSHICLPDAFSNPSIGGDGSVYIGFEDGRLYAMRDADGDGRVGEGEVSSYDFKNAFQGSPGLAPGMLVATPCNGMHVFLS